MLKAIRRWWRYLGTKLGMELDQAADPKVQLEQAIGEAREQHRLLTEHAANVIATQVQLQNRLDRSIEEYGKLTASARHALTMGDRQRAAGDADGAARMDSAARSFAGRLVTLERDVADQKRLLLEATGAADRARQAVAHSSRLLQQRLAQREALLSRLEQAQMQEQMNAAMRQLSASVDGDVPSLAEVRDKIDRRFAQAQAMTEIAGTGVDLQMLEVEEAQQEADAEARLDAIRGSLRITVSEAPRVAIPERSGSGATADEAGATAQATVPAEAGAPDGS